MASSSGALRESMEVETAPSAYDRTKLKIKTFLRPAHVKLNRFALLLENNIYIGRFRMFDYYGGKEEDDGPETRSKTAVGGFLSLAFIAIVLAVIVMNIVKLAKSDRSVVVGDSVQMSSGDDSTTIYGLIPMDGTRADFPVMDIAINHLISFYESQNPTIQKIEIYDNTDHEPMLTSSTDTVHKTRSLYTELSAEYNAAEDNIIQEADDDAQQFSFATAIEIKLYSKYSQVMQPNDILNEFSELNFSDPNSDYFAHTMHLYARFIPKELAQVMNNQLLVAFYNAKQYDDLNTNNARPLSSSQLAQLQTLATSGDTWNFGDDVNLGTLGYNVLHLVSDSSSLNVSSPSYMDWYIEVQYVDTFNYTYQQFYCTNEEQNTGAPTDFYATFWVFPPGPSDTTLEVYSSNSFAVYDPVDLDALFQDVPLPIDIWIWNFDTFEKVTVTSFTNSTLNVIRSINHNFQIDPLGASNYRYNWNVFLNLMEAGPGWGYTYNCPLDWFNDGFCDYYCDVPDIDCAFEGQYSGFDLEAVAAGMGCDPGMSLKFPGSSHIRGYLGDTSQLKPQCYADDPYLYPPSMYDNQTILCFPQPTSSLYQNSLTKETKIFPSHPPFPIGMWFPANLILLGTKSVKAYVYPNLTVAFDGLDSGRGSTNCSETISEFVLFSQGTILSEVVFGQVTFWVMPSDPQQLYFMPAGGYKIALNFVQNDELFAANQMYEVEIASCPDVNGVQVVTFVTPLSSADYSNAALHTGSSVNRGYIALTASFGATVIYVNVTQNTFVDPNANYGTTYITIGIPPTLYKVTGVTDMGNGIEQMITLAQPIQLPYLLGTPVSGLPFASVTIQTNPALELFRPPSQQPYDPVARNASSGSVSPLDIEWAVFQVPLKKNFTHLNGICQNPNNNGPQPAPNETAWLVRTDRRSYIDGCTLTPCVDDCGDGISNTFEFVQHIPLNEKWILPVDEAAQLTSPEYVVDVLLVYYFDYTQSDLDIAAQFSQNTPIFGDMTQDGDNLFFNGQLDYIGPGTVQYYMPANVPTSSFTITLSANKDKTNSMFNDAGKYLGVSKLIGWNKDSVNNFQPITISFADGLPMTIQPGWNYTFTADVALQPIYDVGWIGGQTMDRWINHTTVSHTVSSSGTPTSNKAYVRLIFNFDSQATVLNNMIEFTFFDCVAAIGGAIGLFSIGMLILSFWQYFTYIAEEMEKEREKEEEAERESEGEGEKKKKKNRADEDEDENMENGRSIIVGNNDD